MQDRGFKGDLPVCRVPGLPIEEEVILNGIVFAGHLS